MRSTTLAMATAIAFVTTTPLHAQAMLSAAPSTRATAEVSLTVPGQAAGMAAAPKVIRLEYGQPHLRGRTLHGDSLVPYDTAWRLGANGATTLHTDVDLLLGDLALPSGDYVLEALPTRTTWFLVVQRITGTNADGENTLVETGRVALQHNVLSTPIESLSMWLIPSREPGAARGVLRFAWGTDELSVGWVVK